MSWDVSLNDPQSGKVIELDELRHQIGGNIQLGGSNECEISSFTWNYSAVMCKAFEPYLMEKGFRELNGFTGQQSIPILEHAIAKLDPKTEDRNDYWNPTEGNVRKSLVIMLNWAVARPDGIWEIH